MVPALDRMDAYLASLPGGLESYPEYVQKASVYRQFLELTPIPHGLETLPPTLRELVEHRLPATTWLPEVHVTALYLAAADLLGQDQDAFQRHWYHVNNTLLRSPLYRILMAVASPERILKAADTRWGHLHRGVTTQAVSEHNAAELVLSYPSGLYPRLISLGIGEAFRAAIDLTGAKSVDVRLASYGPTRSTYRASWR